MSKAIILSILIIILVSTNCSKIPSVIIIGSGPAGVAAAARLLENNFTNLTILEAEGRIGGRIHSVKFGDAFVDLGAQWCHGQKNNTVFELVNKYNLLEPDERPSTFYHSSREIIDPVLAEELVEIMDEIYTEKNEAADISLGQHVITRYYSKIIKKYSKDYKKLKLASEMLDYHEKSILETEGAFSIFDVASHMDYRICEGPNLQWKGCGYKIILDILLKKYPNPNQKLPFEEKLHLNKEVVKVMWDHYNEKNPHRATVKCSDGSVYSADHVIFTPSLGVLKNRHRTLFEPRLPYNKVIAIKEVGIAAVGKLLLYFPSRWWPSDDHIDFSFIWDEEDSKRLFEEIPFVSSKDGKHWLMDISRLSSIPENPNVLLAWFVGESMPQIELLPDDVFVDGVMFVLQKFLGHLFNVTSPAKMLRSKWYSNPHFHGTYSFQTVESRKRNVSGHVVLSEPLYSSDGHPTLLFAGEATHPIYYSTVHGAIETGQREADRITNLYK